MIEEIMYGLKDSVHVARGKHYVVSNLSNQIINGDMRGWVCGHFYPKGSVFHRNDIEICFKTLHLGMEEKLHHHLCSFEFLLVLSGKVEYEIDGDRHVLEPGMFYMLEPGNTERIVQVHKETTVLAVRLPSIPRNKIFEDVE
ncbi:MAG: cupin domain-containing protein [Candidatus Omnitrophica bacterium]|nr:cupin domain-containing protein [Candidatus Omnitrophota bacterium]